MVSFSLCCIFRPPYGSAHKCIERATISATVLTWNIYFDVYIQLLHDKHSQVKKKTDGYKKVSAKLTIFPPFGKGGTKRRCNKHWRKYFWICLNIALPDSACSFLHKADMPPLTITRLCQHSSSYIYTSSDRETSEKAEKCHLVLLAAMNYQCCLSA